MSKQKVQYRISPYFVNGQNIYNFGTFKFHIFTLDCSTCMSSTRIPIAFAMFHEPEILTDYMSLGCFLMIPD